VHFLLERMDGFFPINYFIFLCYRIEGRNTRRIMTTKAQTPPIMARMSHFADQQAGKMPKFGYRSHI
jgi:hypothetical protein